MKKHKIITLILVLVMAATAMAGLCSCGKPVAEIPDPEYFFGSYDELNEHDDVKQVILRSDRDLWTEAAAYVNLLKYSGKYEFVSFDEDRYPSGDYTWNFKYNGSEEIKDAYFAQIEINYYCKSNGRDVYAVWITLHDLDNFELVQNDRFDPNNIYGTEAYTQATQPTQPATGSWSQSSNSSWDDDSDSSDDDFWDNDNDDLYDSKVQCGVCDGDGDCGTCGGDGLLHSSASDKEDRNCYSCSGSGNCRSCGGDGEL